MLIETDCLLSQWNKCIGMTNLLEEIVHRPALRVDDRCPSVFEQLRGQDGWAGLLQLYGWRE
jgi:hypothetical protein